MEERDEREKISPTVEGGMAEDKEYWRESAVTVHLLTSRQEKFRAHLK